MRIASRKMVFLLFLSSASAVPGPMVSLLPAQASIKSCRASDSGLRVDHVVIAVSDLDKAGKDYRSLGFTLNPGRLHPNGLLNAHVKFNDGTELELMSIRGEPTDSVAREYATFLHAGDGGAYLAIAADPARVEDAARGMDLPSRTTRSGPFTWVVVDDSKGSANGEASPVFFVSYAARPVDHDSLLVHAVGASGIISVGLDASDELELLLGRLGAMDCENTAVPSVVPETRLGLSNAELILHMDPDRRRRAAVLGVTLAGTARDSVTVFDVGLTHGVTLSIEPISPDQP